MEKPLLNDPDVFPMPEVLAKTLGKSFAVLDELITAISTDDYETTLEWRFYNDGKAWLGKVCYKKKTIFWLSVWDGYFKTGFYFAEKPSLVSWNCRLTKHSRTSSPKTNRRES